MSQCALFTYGSLMYEPVWDSLVSGSYRKTAATLEGYARFGVKGEDYPVIKPSTPEQFVEGCVYWGVSLQDQQVLDQFEGEYYQRLSLPVVTLGTSMTADVYVLKPDYYHIASEASWDVAAFERSGLQRFLSQHQGFLSSDQ